ncbi:AzlC family ABC transporter permease [Piscinibacter sakaiensis]|nr:AzlC family ABC transporter permease [Piscinibacter sakaiensis]
MAEIAPGMAAWGLMIGVAMVKSGMSLVEILLMGLFVFAGSSQLAAIPLIAAGAPMAVILATAFCVNLRFVVFSLHLRDYVMHLPPLRRLFAGYLVVDLNYVFVTRRFPQPAALDDAAGRQAQDAYWLGTGVVCWVNWSAFSLLGVALGHSVPEAWGLGFAGILSLLGILCSLIGSRLRALAAAVAGAAAVAAHALPLKLNILVAIAAAVVVCLLLERARPAAADGAAR